MRILIKYGIGYGRHDDEIEMDDDATDEEIEESVRDVVMQRLDWSWKKEE